jgi:hypothetical protein
MVQLALSCIDMAELSRPSFVEIVRQLRQILEGPAATIPPQMQQTFNPQVAHLAPLAPSLVPQHLRPGMIPAPAGLPNVFGDPAMFGSPQPTPLMANNNSPLMANGCAMMFDPIATHFDGMAQLSYVPQQGGDIGHVLNHSMRAQLEICRFVVEEAPWLDVPLEELPPQFRALVHFAGAVPAPHEMVPAWRVGRNHQMEWFNALLPEDKRTLISREHFEVHAQEAREVGRFHFYLTNLSSNYTYLNGRRVEKGNPEMLCPNDEVRFCYQAKDQDPDPILRLSFDVSQSCIADRLASPPLLPAAVVAEAARPASAEQLPAQLRADDARSANCYNF